MTMSKDGFFEGVYNFIPGSFLEGRAVTDAMLRRYLPHLTAWSMSLVHARPVLDRFPDGVERALRRLRPPFWQTNQLVQIGQQYFHGEREWHGVPDAYVVRFTRIGRFGKADAREDLTISILRSSVAVQLLKTDEDDPRFDDIARRWMMVAVHGSHHGNAVICQSRQRYHSRGLFSRMSNGKERPLKPATTAVAEGAFQTIYYWQP